MAIRAKSAVDFPEIVHLSLQNKYSKSLKNSANFGTKNLLHYSGVSNKRAGCENPAG